jgi:hypothetical protein
MMKREEFYSRLTSITNGVEKLKGKEFPEKDSTISILNTRITEAKETMSALEKQFYFIFPEESNRSQAEKIKLNVGGRNLDFKISFCEDNLLSWILHPKWSSYLIHDKDNRIYFDYEETWLEPLLRTLVDDVYLDPFYPQSEEVSLVGKQFTDSLSKVVVKPVSIQTLRDILKEQPFN